MHEFGRLQKNLMILVAIASSMEVEFVLTRQDAVPFTARNGLLG